MFNGFKTLSKVNVAYLWAVLDSEGYILAVTTTGQELLFTSREAAIAYRNNPPPGSRPLGKIVKVMISATGIHA